MIYDHNIPLFKSLNQHILKNEAAGSCFILLHLEGIRLGRGNKSKRFVQQGVDSVTKHAERIPYHMTYAEAEAQKLANVKESSLGGI